MTTRCSHFPLRQSTRIRYTELIRYKVRGIVHVVHPNPWIYWKNTRYSHCSVYGLAKTLTVPRITSVENGGDWCRFRSDFGTQLSVSNPVYYFFRRSTLLPKTASRTYHLANAFPAVFRVCSSQRPSICHAKSVFSTWTACAVRPGIGAKYLIWSL